MEIHAGQAPVFYPQEGAGSRSAGGDGIPEEAVGEEICPGGGCAG